MTGGRGHPRDVDTMEKAVAVIPARFASSRLPGKPLLVAAGKTLLAHVLARVLLAREISDTIVATDDQRIADEAARSGARAILTSKELETGSDRVGAVLDQVEGDIIVNVQGDEPDIDPALIDRLVHRLRSEPDLGVVTAAAPYPVQSRLDDPNRVKVVTDRRGRALYFSRALIPHVRGQDLQREPLGSSWPHLHVGVYAYRRHVLSHFLKWPRGRLEQLENLEQLRLLENGVPIAVELSEAAPAGVDTPADFEAFRKRVESQPFESAD